jgi:periplasmic protein TonB
MEFLVLVGVILVLSVLMTIDTSWNNILTALRNQLVFADRNKEYGAFVLRRDYVRRLGFSIVGSIAIFGFALAAPLIVAAIGSGEDEVEAKKIVDVNLELFEEEDKTPPPPPPPVEPPPPPKIETVQFTALEAVDEPVEEPPPTQEVLAETVAATESQEGEKVDEPPPVVESDEPMLFAAVEEKPTFPGGEAAFYKYLEKNMQYPEMEKEQGIKGKVWVDFMIDKNGEVTDVKIARGVSPGLDKEALRVMKAMPSWAPGKQNGRPVKVKYTLPINFNLR